MLQSSEFVIVDFVVVMAARMFSKYSRVHAHECKLTDDAEPSFHDH